MRKTLKLILILALFSLLISGCAPKETPPSQPIVWQKTYGGGSDDEACSIQQTSDGGYIVAGYTSSFGAGGGDVYVIKLDENGDKVWEKTYGGSGYDIAYSIQQTNDGGYIIAGKTGDFYSGDVYIIKLDANGNKVWQKTYGGSGDDVAFSIQQTTDGGYIVAGYTSSFVAGGWYRDVYVIKLDENGNEVWEKTYGGSDDDWARSIQQTSDGGYIVAGWTESFGGGGDVYIIKLNAYGNKEWEKTFGGSSYDRACSIQQTKDGGYIVAGSTGSLEAGYADVYVIRLDKDGNKIWEKTYGGSDDDEATSIQQTKDGGYIVAGGTESFGAGKRDVYIIKLDGNGNKIWEKTYGGSGDDDATSIQQTKDEGYIVAGSTRSFGFDQDAYVIKLDENGNLTYSVNNLIYSSNMVKEKVKSAMKIMQTALEMNAIDNNGFYTDNLLDLLDYLPDNQFPKHPLTNKPYEIGINLFEPVNGGSPVKNSSDIRYQYAIVYKYDASNNKYTLIGYDQTNTKVIFELSNR